MKKILLALLIIFAFHFFCYSHVQAAPVGKFTFIAGRVDVTSPGQAARSVKVGDNISEGDIIRTKSDSKAEITFLDGNILRLAQSTRVEAAEYITGIARRSGKFSLFRGKIQNIVKAAIGAAFGYGKNNRYEVHTPTAVIGVRGTDFFVYHTEGISGSAFKEGSGYVYSLNRPDQILEITAGQSMEVSGPDLLPVIRPTNEFELNSIENETSPQENAETNTSGGSSGSFSDLLKRGLDNETTEERFIKEGIDEKMRGTERFENQIEIPRTVTTPEEQYY